MARSLPLLALQRHCPRSLCVPSGHAYNHFALSVGFGFGAFTLAWAASPPLLMPLWSVPGAHRTEEQGTGQTEVDHREHCADHECADGEVEQVQYRADVAEEGNQAARRAPAETHGRHFFGPVPCLLALGPLAPWGLLASLREVNPPAQGD